MGSANKAGNLRSGSDNQSILATRLPASEPDYEVGYAKPPLETRFEKGKSGNPRGRPPGSKNKKSQISDQGVLEERLKQIVIDEAYRGIKINEGDKQITVPIAQAVIRSVAHSAARGNIRAQRLFAEMVGSTEAARVKSNTELFEAAIEYKERWTVELERRARLGIVAPDPLPHPDDVHINPDTGRVRFTGPKTEEEKFEWDWLRSRKTEWEEEVACLKTEIANNTDPSILPILEEELAHSNRLLDQLRLLFPDPDARIKIMQRQKQIKMA